MSNTDALKLDNQLCFRLYAASKEIIRQYSPLLDELDLTYTQYITLLVLWEKDQISVKELGNKLYLDSGTLTPLLKQLETKGYVARTRNNLDERNLIISITKKGIELKKEAVKIPSEIVKCVKLNPDEAKNLYEILHKILGS